MPKINILEWIKKPFLSMYRFWFYPSREKTLDMVNVFVDRFNFENPAYFAIANPMTQAVNIYTSAGHYCFCIAYGCIDNSVVTALNVANEKIRMRA